MFNSGGYYHALDRGRVTKEELIEDPIRVDEKPITNLGPQELGTGASIMQHQLQSLNAKIREGAGKVEFVFSGAGKGSQQAFTPESFDSKERMDMRDLADINEVKTTTHASVNLEGLGGMTQEGFNPQARYHTFKELKKAIDFAAEATTGGAIVVHTGEWQRPISEQKWNNGEVKFSGFEEESKKAPMMIVDDRTGNIQGIRKDQDFFEPKFHTAETYEKVVGKKLVGTTDDNGNKIETNDWVDVKGNAIKQDWEFDINHSEDVFERVPVWNSEGTKFETEKRNFSHFENKANEWNKRHPDQSLTPEEMFFKTQIMNKVLQAKGSSLYHAQRYESHKFSLSKLREALNFYESLEEGMPEKNKWQIMQKRYPSYMGAAAQLITPDEELPSELLKRSIKEEKDQMKYVHEASASADVQASQAQEDMKHVTTISKYGLKESAKTLAEAGLHAMHKYDQHRDTLKDPLYVAPENWRAAMYGGHPEEIRTLVEEGRKEMIKRLTPSKGKDEAEKLAQQHIKSTIDIGHLNLWRQHMERKEGENDKEFDNRFNKWAMSEIKKLHKAGVLGHFHIADNFGYDDEHLTPGRGNAPIKEFVQMLEKEGYKDFVVEGGSFNFQTALADSLSYFGSPVYSLPTGQRFNQVHQAHFGYQAPPNYIVGAYSPTNEWSLWSQVPLE